MINRQYEEMLLEKDEIFEIFQYSLRQAKVVGKENVYDFSLGNPSVAAPKIVDQTLTQKITALDSLSLHGYSPSLGLPDTREQIAENLNKKYHCHYTKDHIFMTMGAAGALAHAFRAVTNPGDEIVTFAPCFSEYKPYTKGAGLHLKIVPADIDTFQIPFALLNEYLTPKTSAVLINSPNNPSGIVYSTSTIQRLCDLLRKKAQEFGHPIYLISDEPYRDILFEGTDSPYIANYYADTLTCYSFSKSLSLPGERIGYLSIHPECTGGEKIFEICPQISRTIGHNGPASLMQHAIAPVCMETADLSVYEKNKNILLKALEKYGYSCVHPGGTFYMFPRALEQDAYAFCQKAREKNLMLVPGDIFQCPGHFRIAYCVPTERIEKALPVFQALAEEYLAL